LRTKAQQVYEAHFAPGPDLVLLADALTCIQQNRNEQTERLIRSIWPLFERSAALKQDSYQLMKRAVLKMFAMTGRKFPYTLNRSMEEQLHNSTK
jgi:hypothetical protein